MASRLVADISSNNSEFDAKAYHDAGHIMVAIKATESDRYLNPSHRTWTYHAQLHHIAVVHYHFARPDLGNDPIDEADWFWRCVQPLAGPRDYLVLDLERATPDGWSHDPEWSFRFAARIRNLGRFSPILYANRSTLQQSDTWLPSGKLRAWDADWSTDANYAPPGYTCVLRQFTNGAVGPEPHSLTGVGPCDVSSMSVPFFRTVAARS